MLKHRRRRHDDASATWNIRLLCGGNALRTLPEGVQPGQTLQVQGPSGAIVQLQVPAGALPGQVIQVAAPLAPTVVGQPVQPA